MKELIKKKAKEMAEEICHLSQGGQIHPNDIWRDIETGLLEMYERGIDDSFAIITERYDPDSGSYMNEPIHLEGVMEAMVDLKTNNKLI